MSNAINPKVVRTGRQFDEHAKRYIFFPTHNLDMAGSQATSPIWSPKIPKARFVLLESFEYFCQVPSDNEFSGGGVVLGQRTMGTDDQVKFLMGSHDGSGFLERGMTFLESITDINPDLAIKIEKMILPIGVDGEVATPEDLIELKAHLDKVAIDGENPIADIAKKTLAEVRDGVARAINYCMSMAGTLEKELHEGRAGRMGIKSLNASQEYYFKQIRRPLPEDRTGFNMGEQLVRALQPILGNKPATEPVNKDFQNEIELDLLKQRLAQVEADNQKLTETVTQQSEVIATYEDSD